MFLCGASHRHPTIESTSQPALAAGLLTSDARAAKEPHVPWSIQADFGALPGRAATISAFIRVHPWFHTLHPATAKPRARWQDPMHRENRLHPVAPAPIRHTPPA